MPVEVAKIVDDFNKLWPRGTDPVSKADDHIRMIKEVLQLEFELLYNKTRIFSFEKGAVVNPDCILYYEAEKAFYQWNGGYNVNNEYIVPAGSTPETAGGIGGNAWTRSTGSGFMSTVLVSDTAPTNPFQNMLWWDTNSGVFFIYYNDGTSTQWVDLFGMADQTSFTNLLFRTVLVRLAAESGYNLVGGSFQEGAVSSGFSDVILDWDTAKFYQWHLNEVKTVSAGSTPTNIGTDWVDKSKSFYKRFACVADMVSDTSLVIGQIVETIGYYDGWAATSIKPKGGNRYEIVAAATGTDDGGSFITLNNELQAKGLFIDAIATPEQFGCSISECASKLNALNSFCASSGITCVAAGDYTVASEVKFYGGEDYSLAKFIITAFTTDGTVCHIYQPITETFTLSSTLSKGVNTHPQMKVANSVYVVNGTDLYTNRVLDDAVSEVIYKREIFTTSPTTYFTTPSNLTITAGSVSRKEILEKTVVKIPTLDFSGITSNIYSAVKCTRANTDVYMREVIGQTYTGSVYTLIEAHTTALVNWFDAVNKLATISYFSNHYAVHSIKHYNCTSLSNVKSAYGEAAGSNGNFGRFIEFYDCTLPNISWHSNGWFIRGFRCHLKNNSAYGGASTVHGGGEVGLYDCHVYWTQAVSAFIFSNRVDYGGEFNGVFKARNITVHMYGTSADIRLVSTTIVNSVVHGTVQIMPDCDIDGLKIINYTGVNQPVRPIRFVTALNGGSADWSYVTMPTLLKFKNIDCAGMPCYYQYASPDITMTTATATSKTIELIFDNILCSNDYKVDAYQHPTLINSLASNVSWKYTFNDAGALYPRFFTMKNIAMTFSGEKTIFCGVKLQTADTASDVNTRINLIGCKIYRGRFSPYSDTTSQSLAIANSFNIFAHNCEMLSKKSVDPSTETEVSVGEIVKCARVAQGCYCNSTYVTPYNYSGNILNVNFKLTPWV